MEWESLALAWAQRTGNGVWPTIHLQVTRSNSTYLGNVRRYALLLTECWWVAQREPFAVTSWSLGTFRVFLRDRGKGEGKQTGRSPFDSLYDKPTRQGWGQLRWLEVFGDNLFRHLAGTNYGCRVCLRLSHKARWPSGSEAEMLPDQAQGSDISLKPLVLSCSGIIR